MIRANYKSMLNSSAVKYLWVACTQVEEKNNQRFSHKPTLSSLFKVSALSAQHISVGQN